MTPGTILFAEKHGHITVGDVLASGGGGTVYRLRGNGTVLLKVWHAKERPAHPEFLLKTIQQYTQDLKYVAHIIEPVRERAGGEIVGFLMERIKGVALADKKFKYTWLRIHAARIIAFTLAALEQRGAFFPDGNGGNVIIASWTGNAYLIDIDGLAFKAVLWPDGKKAPRHPQKIVQNWSPPEFWGKTSVIEHTEHTNAFVCARLVYQVLLDAHPAQCSEPDGKVIPLQPPYPRWFLECKWGRFSGELPKGVVPVDRGITWEELSDWVKMLFRHAFSERCLKDPALRVSTQEIHSVLDAQCVTKIGERAVIGLRTHTLMVLWLVSVMFVFVLGVTLGGCIPSSPAQPQTQEQMK